MNRHSSIRQALDFAGSRGQRAALAGAFAIALAAAPAPRPPQPTRATRTVLS